MNTHVCPWWLTYSFDNPLRRLLHDPTQILTPHVRAGMVAADLGCGMGYFTAALAGLVGPAGRVQAVDLQPQQLARAQSRCHKAAVAERVTFTVATPDALRLEGRHDFVLAFWMVHEVPDIEKFLKEIKAHLVPGGRVLIAEPRLHVSGKSFATTVAIGEGLGFQATPVAGVRISRAVVLTLPV